MLFVLVYFLFAVAVTSASIAALWNRRGKLSRGRIALYIIIPIVIWASPIVIEEFYGIHIVNSREGLPGDSSFLDGIWIGQSTSVSEKIEIAISQGRFEAMNLPHTGEYRDRGKLQFESFSGLIELDDWASGVAILFNDFDPVYIARQSGHWRLVQNLDVSRGSQIVFKKSKAEQREALKP